LEINPRGEAALKPLPMKPVCSTNQPTPQYLIGKKISSDMPIPGTNLLLISSANSGTFTNYYLVNPRKSEQKKNNHYQQATNR
jgi:hypothetical protein